MVFNVYKYISVLNITRAIIDRIIIAEQSRKLQVGLQ